MGLDNIALERLSLAAYLHDIGKVGTPDAILQKPTHLTPEERMMVQEHAACGAQIIASMPDFRDIADIVNCHHEHFDGSGSPAGLSGERIPLASRIVLVADAYDAMTSPRPFREALTHEEAIARLEAGAGRQFDPAAVSAFKNVNTNTHVYLHQTSYHQLMVS